MPLVQQIRIHYNHIATRHYTPIRTYHTIPYHRIKFNFAWHFTETFINSITFALTLCSFIYVDIADATAVSTTIKYRNFSKHQTNLENAIFPQLWFSIRHTHTQTRIPKFSSWYWHRSCYQYMLTLCKCLSGT